ncbi:MAG: leucine-rich repeat protein [Prevotella sp.]|nr:leucine-rich repeat protein [Prevotella sp.]
MVEGAPVGVYEIEVQGFYRYWRGDLAWNSYQNQDNNYVKPKGAPVYVYMNNNATPFVNVFDEPVAIGEVYEIGTYTDPNGVYWYPDEMWSSALAFAAGMYKQSAYGLVAQNGDVLRLGVKGVSNQQGDSWVIWDNFKLTYRGFDATVIKPILEEAIADCQGLSSAVMSQTAKKNLQDALSNAKDALDSASGETMFQALNTIYDAKEAATSSRDAYAQLNDRIANLSDAINVARNNGWPEQSLEQAKSLLEKAQENYLGGLAEDSEIQTMLNDIDATVNTLYGPVPEIEINAEEYVDTQYNVVYCYDPDGTTAWVKEGQGNYEAGSPDATGSIVILSELNIGEKTYTVNRIGKGAFNNCTQLTSVVIPSSVKYIDWYAFYNCGLESVDIPEGVQTVGFSFLDCPNLKSAHLPSTVQITDLNPFFRCSSLTEITVAPGNPYIDSRNNCNAIIETATGAMISGCNTTVIPAGVTRLNWGAMAGMYGLEVVEIPEGVTALDAYAFELCRNLKEVKLPESLTMLGWEAFYGCSSLTSITIPKNIAEIHDHVLGNCPNLSRIYMMAEEPIEVEHIAFENWDGTIIGATLLVPEASMEKYKAAPVWSEFTRIKAITYPIGEQKEYTDPASSVIYSYWTDDTEALVKPGVWSTGSPEARGEVTILSAFEAEGKEYTVSAIGDYAFYYNDIATVTIPATVKSIGNYAFSSWSLQSIIVLGEEPAAIQEETFDGQTYEDATLYVPEGSKEAYQAAEGWNRFNNIQEGSPVKYLLTFMVDDEVYSQSELNAGAVTVSYLPADPTKEGYNFIGWDTEVPYYMPAEDVTVNAVFEFDEAAAFAKYQSEQQAVAASLAEEGDSEACLKLIAEAEMAIEALTFDPSKTLDENMALIDEIIAKLATALEQQRAAEKAAAEAEAAAKKAAEEAIAALEERVEAAVTAKVADNENVIAAKEAAEEAIAAAKMVLEEATTVKDNEDVAAAIAAATEAVEKLEKIAKEASINDVDYELIYDALKYQYYKLRKQFENLQTYLEEQCPDVKDEFADQMNTIQALLDDANITLEEEYANHELTNSSKLKNATEIANLMSQVRIDATKAQEEYNVATSVEAINALSDGEAAEAYTVGGSKVRLTKGSKQRKGIYIINGKKVVR